MSGIFKIVNLHCYLPAKTALVQYKTVRDNLQRTLDGEDCGEKVVKIIQNLKEKDSWNRNVH